MGLFGEVKCGRCDRRYSAVRSRCPYCGARKRKSGKSSGSGDNRWQVVFGVILLAAIILAVAVLIYKNLQEGASKAKTTPTPAPTVQATSTPKPSMAPTPSAGLPAVTPAPTTKITSLVLSRQDFTLSTIGETWLLTATVAPTGATSNITWTSLDPKVATVNSEGRVTAVANGTTTITAEAGGVKASCVVRINAAGAPAAPSPSGSGGTSNPGGTSGITLSHTDVTLNATTGESFTLKVNGSTSAATFSGGSSSVATVDSSGVVKAIAPGTTTIYVTVGSTKLECVVRVIKK